jgi:hypothetical protein
MIDPPCPVPPADRHRLRGARLAASLPAPAASPVTVQRRVSQRGSILVATQHIQVGMIPRPQSRYRDRRQPQLSVQREQPDNLRCPAHQHARDPSLQGLREQGRHGQMTDFPQLACLARAYFTRYEHAALAIVNTRLALARRRFWWRSAANQCRGAARYVRVGRVI